MYNMISLPYSFKSTLKAMLYIYVYVNKDMGDGLRGHALDTQERMP